MVVDRDEILQAAYRSILGRDPDPSGAEHYGRALDSGFTLGEMLATLVDSTEFRARALLRLLPPIELPDLTQRYPDRYRWEEGRCVFHQASDSDFDRFEELIIRHRFYDFFEGSFWPTMDVSKVVTAEIVRGLGAGSCLEIGCFNGLVVGLLKQAGLDVTGIDASHLAFALADAQVREHMLFGDLLDLSIQRKFDAIVGMDIYEHLNPVKFSAYIGKTKQLLAPEGYVVICSPMHGRDDIFGEVIPKYLREWMAKPAPEFWRDIHCTQLGWPVHGHLVWQSPVWWEDQFQSGGLVRDRELEILIHAELGWFYQQAPYRKPLFVLKHAENTRPAAALATLMRETLSNIPR